MKGAGAEATPNIVTIEFEKYQNLMNTNDQLMQKNREYLEMLGAKSTLNTENERLKGEIKKMSGTLSQISSQYSQFRS